MDLTTSIITTLAAIVAVGAILVIRGKPVGPIGRSARKPAPPAESDEPAS